MNVRDVSAAILRKLDARDPFSLIRLGDGEGLLLSISPDSPSSDFDYLTGHLGPEGISLDGVQHLKDRLMQSIREADIIGLRNDIIDVTFEPSNLDLPPDQFLEVFRRRFRLRQVEMSLGYHGSRRIASLHKALGRIELRDSAKFCSAWFHYEYHNSGSIFELLKQQRTIGLISCRAQLPQLLEERFGVSVQYHEVPDMFRCIPPDRRVPNYVGQLERILHRQIVQFPGMLCLVGAGLYGKLYCGMIKSQGGIAIDLGSLFDAWLGIASRPMVYRSLFHAGAEEVAVPRELLLRADEVDR